jgi:hypothetical protein
MQKNVLMVAPFTTRDLAQRSIADVIFDLQAKMKKKQCCGSGSTGSTCFWASWYGGMDPDPHADPASDPDPSIIKQK